MNRLGSGSDWLTRCCCFEKSLVECSAQWKKKKKINLGLSLVQGSQIIEVLFAVVHTRADTQLWIQLEGLVFRVVPPPIPHPRPPAFPAKPAFTSVSPLSPRGGGGAGDAWGRPSSAALAWIWGPPARRSLHTEEGTCRLLPSAKQACPPPRDQHSLTSCLWGLP